MENMRLLDGVFIIFPLDQMPLQLVHNWWRLSPKWKEIITWSSLSIYLFIKSFLCLNVVTYAEEERMWPGACGLVDRRE